MGWGSRKPPRTSSPGGGGIAPESRRSSRGPAAPSLPPPCVLRAPPPPTSSALRRRGGGRRARAPPAETAPASASAASSSAGGKSPAGAPGGGGGEPRAARGTAGVGLAARRVSPARLGAGDASPGLCMLCRGGEGRGGGTGGGGAGRRGPGAGAARWGKVRRAGCRAGPRGAAARPLRAGGEAAPGTGTPRGAGVSVYNRGRPSLCPAPVSGSGPLAHEGMRGAGQRRCEFGPGWSRSPPDTGARGGHRSTTHRGGSDMMGRLI